MKTPVATTLLTSVLPITLALSAPVYAAPLQFGCLWGQTLAIMSAAREYQTRHPQVELAFQNRGESARQNDCGPLKKAPELLEGELDLGWLINNRVEPGRAGSLDEVVYSTTAHNSRPLPLAKGSVVDLQTIARGAPPLQNAFRAMPTNLAELAERDGVLWAIPQFVTMPVYAVRVDLYDAAGLALGSDWDWNTFLIDAAKSRAIVAATASHVPAGEVVYGTVLPQPRIAALWHALFLGNSAKVIDPNGAGHFESPENLATLNVLRSWIDSKAIGLFDRFSSQWYENNWGSAIQQGVAAAQPMQSRELLALSLGADGPWPEGARLVPMPMPHAPGHAPAPQPVNRVIGWAIAAATPADQQAEAADVIAWLIQQPVTYAGTGLLPPIPEVGLQVYGRSAAPYYALLTRARFFLGLPYRFAQHFWDFYAGLISAREFAEIVDHG